MADWYIDLVNGNDANGGDSWTLTASGTDGQTYGNLRFTAASASFDSTYLGRYIKIASSWHKIMGIVSGTEVTLDRTYSSGTNRVWRVGGALATPQNMSSVFIAPGDRFKVAKTSDPVAAGDFTYTSKSATVTIPSGKIKVIDQCESGWTGATDITAAHTSQYAQDGNAIRLTPASGFTTGKMAYKGFGEDVDFSDFAGVTLAGYFGAANTFSAGRFQLCLCSDDTGDVVVDTIQLMPWAVYGTAYLALGGYRTGGGALGSAIRSVALYAANDPGTYYIQLDNIVAVLAADDPDHLCHRCVIGQGNGLNDDWWAISCFPSETTVNLTRPWYGGTEGVVASYVREMIPHTRITIPNVGGSTDSSKPVVLSGGWNPATGLQDGMTALTAWPTASGDRSIIFSWASASEAWKLERFLLGGSINWGSYPMNMVIEDLTFVSRAAWSGDSNECFEFGTGTHADHATSENVELRRVRALGVYSLMVMPYSMASIYEESAINWVWEDVRVRSITNPVELTGLYNFEGRDIEVSYCTHATKAAIVMDQCLECDFYGLTIRDAYRPIQSILFAHNIRIWDLVCSGMTEKHILATIGRFKVFGPQQDGGTMSRYRSGSVLRVKQEEERPYYGDYASDGSITSDISTRHASSGYAYKISPTNGYMPRMRLKVASVLIEAGVPVTFCLWMRRDSLDIAASFYLPGRQVAGIATTQEVAFTAAVNTWEQVELGPVTPSETGVVDLWVSARGGTTASVWIDDFTVVLW